MSDSEPGKETAVSLRDSKSLEAARRTLRRVAAMLPEELGGDPADRHTTEVANSTRPTAIRVRTRE